LVILVLHYILSRTNCSVCYSYRFLARCANWVGEGPHLQLLEILLELGFDASLVDSPHAQDWPEPSSPNWWAEGLTPDPFFVEYQSMLLRDNQGRV
jgi:hypothetical protein